MPRRRAWADALLDEDLGSGQLNIDLLASAPAVDTITTARLIGRIQVVPVALDATDDAIQIIDMGIQVVTAEAFAAAVVPDPFTQADAPARGWLWRTRMVMLKQNSTGTVEDFIYPLVEFDLGTMRKVDKGKLVLTVDKQSTAGVAFSVTVIGIIRTLCLT